jgi:hypothetical protein
MDTVAEAEDPDDVPAAAPPPPYGLPPQAAVTTAAPRAPAISSKERFIAVSTLQWANNLSA